MLFELYKLNIFKVYKGNRFPIDDRLLFSFIHIFICHQMTLLTSVNLYYIKKEILLHYLILRFLLLFHGAGNRLETWICFEKNQIYAIWN